MTDGALLFMENDSRTLQGRLAQFLNSRYPPLGGADALARDIHVQSRTARNYLAGMWPGARAWRSIVRVWGRDVLAAVFDPEIDAVSAGLVSEIRALEAELEHRKAALRGVTGAEKGVAQPANRRG